MTIQEIKQKCIDSLNEEPKEPTELEKGYSIAMRHIIEVLSQLPQQEISDEEIEKAAKSYADVACLPQPEFDNVDDTRNYNSCVYDFKIACKWYREQLKQR